MKKSYKKFLALTLAVVMVLGMLAGCGDGPSGSSNSPSDSSNTPSGSSPTGGDSSGGGIDTSEYVELKMYLVGDKPDGFDEVYEKVNEILKEKVNATVTVDWLSWAEHGTKYSLLFSGGEDFDMIFTASSWCHFEQTVGLGGFAALSPEMIQTYAPDVWATLPESAWTQATINGNIYMIPANYIEVTPDVVAIRGDMMQQFGYDDIKSYDQLMDFYADCAANGMYGNAVGSSSVYWLWFQSNGMRTVSGAPSDGELVLYKSSDPSDTSLTYILDENSGFAEYCREMKALADAGCWPSDVLSSTQDRQDGLVNGRGASMVWNAGSCQTYANQANAEHPDWNINVYNIMPDMDYFATKYINGGMGFNYRSKNLERALMVYNLFATDQDIQDLTQLGIKGTHWQDAGEGLYEVIEGNRYNTSNNWAWRNMDIMKEEYQANPTAVDTKVNELKEYFMANVSSGHPLDDFAFNTDPVSTQFAAVEAAMGQYFDPLVNGLVTDVDASLEQFRSALESAGIQAVLDEMRSQVDAYLAG